MQAAPGRPAVTGSESPDDGVPPRAPEVAPVKGGEPGGRRGGLPRGHPGPN